MVARLFLVMARRRVYKLPMIAAESNPGFFHRPGTRTSPPPGLPVPVARWWPPRRRPVPIASESAERRQRAPPRLGGAGERINERPSARAAMATLKAGGRKHAQFPPQSLPAQSRSGYPCCSRINRQPLSSATKKVREPPCRTPPRRPPPPRASYPSPYPSTPFPRLDGARGSYF